MLIINPVANQTNNFKNLNFGIFFPRRIFSDIRDIPNMKCGCCGKDTFTSDKVKTFINSFQAGSKRALENSAMDKYRDTEAFNFIKTLSEIQPKTPVRTLIAIPENSAKIKTLSPRAHIDIKMIALISDGITVKAPRVMQKLEKYRNFFGTEDNEILKVMDFYALKYPKKTFSEIFNLPEVAEYHKQIFETNKQEASLKRIEVFKHLKEFGEKLNPGDKKSLQQANTKAITILNNTYFQPHIKKELINDLYENFAQNSEGKIRKSSIFRIIKDMPMAGMTPDEFIISHVQARSSDKDIVSYFVKRMQATYEHFKAKSKNGTDAQENIIVLCEKCNKERANLPYPFFLRFHPEMPENLQRQLNKIMTFIRNGKLVGYDDYPMNMKQNVLGESAALIRPKIGDYLKFRAERASQSLEMSKAKLVEDEELFNAANSRLNEIDAQIEAVEAQLRKLKKEKRVIKEVFTAAQQEKDNTESFIATKTERLEKMQENLDADRQTNAGLKYKRRKFKKPKP